MGGERRSATSTLNERVTRGVEAELRAAVAARWEPPPEVFLWRVRRCIEAMVYALLVDEKVDVAQLGDKTLEELCRHDKLRSALSKEARSHLDSLRQYGNAGTHFQLDGGVSDDSATIAANALVPLVRWYFERGDRPMSDEIRAHLAALLDRERRLAPPLERERDRALARVASLERRLAGAPTGLVGASTSDQDDAPAAWWTIGPRVVRWALVSGVLMVAAFAFGRSTRDPVTSSAAIETVTSADPPAPTPAPVAAPPAAPVEAAAPSPVVAPNLVAAPTPTAEAATPLHCDPGMHLVPSTGGAAPFCIDDNLVTTAEYQSCVEADAGGCTQAGRTSYCNSPNALTDRTRPANCVSREDARHYCAWRYPDRGRLPSRQDLLGRRELRFHQAPGTSEWSDTELSPSGHMWILAGPGGVRAPQAPSTRSSGVSFRCVVR